jgi:hypothetical protein
MLKLVKKPGLANKAKEHNDAVGDNPAKRATVGMLRTVFRRGAGAFSTSHRPGITRDQWSYARVNAFLYLLLFLCVKVRSNIYDLRELARATSLVSLGSIQTLLRPHLSTEAAKRLCSLKVAIIFYK